MTCPIKGDRFLAYPKRRGQVSENVTVVFFSTQMGIERTQFKLYGMSDFLIDSLKITFNLAIILFW